MSTDEMLKLAVLSLLLAQPSPQDEFDRLWRLGQNPGRIAPEGSHVRFRMTEHRPPDLPISIQYEVWKHGDIYRVRQDTDAPPSQLDRAVNADGIAWTWLGGANGQLSIFEPGIAAPAGYDFATNASVHWPDWAAFNTQGLSLIRNWPSTPPPMQRLSENSFRAVSVIPNAQLEVQGTVTPLAITSIVQSGTAKSGPFMLRVTPTWNDGRLTRLDYVHQGIVTRTFDLQLDEALTLDEAKRITAVPSEGREDAVRGPAVVGAIDDSRGRTRTRSELRDGQRVTVATAPSGGALVRSVTRNSWIAGGIAVVALILIRLYLKGRGS